MNMIVRQMWDRDLTVKKWSALNGFNFRYVGAVIRGNRGQWRCGTGKKIIEALVNQGFSNPQQKEEGQ